jgi:hypothetical protein
MRANSPFLTPYSPKGETLPGMIWTKTVTKFRTNHPCPEGENSLSESKFNINAALNFEINQIKKRNMFPFRG